MQSVKQHALTIAMAVLGCAMLAAGGGPEMIKTASGIDALDTDGVAKIVQVADRLITPAIVALAAIAPLACLVGAGALLFGNRKGLVMIGSAIGTLVFVVSIKGLIS